MYLRARYLSPELGTFVSLDPFEGIAQHPMSLNGYSWVEGNTPNAVDPNGRQACTAGYKPGTLADGSQGCISISAVGEYGSIGAPSLKEVADYYNAGACTREQVHAKCSEGCYQAHRYAPSPWPLFNCLSRCDTNLYNSRKDALNQRAIELRNLAMAKGITELEVLARTADYGCELGFSTLEITSELSRIFVGTDQWTGMSLLEGLIDGLIVPGTEPVSAGLLDGVSPFGGNNNSGLHPDYDDGKNQLFHFVPYMSSVAHGGALSEILALIGNYVHEDLGFPDFSGGASWQDENLAYAGMSIGADIWYRQVPPCQLGNYLRAVLSSSVPDAIGNRSTIPDQYPWIAICRIAPNDYWCRPSVPYPER